MSEEAPVSVGRIEDPGTGKTVGHEAVAPSTDNSHTYRAEGGLGYGQELPGESSNAGMPNFTYGGEQPASTTVRQAEFADLSAEAQALVLKNQPARAAQIAAQTPEAK